MLRKELPVVGDRVPKGEPGKNTKPHDAVALDVGRAERVLGMRWRGKRETFMDMAMQFLEIEGSGG
jgi:hypothetical protein